MVSHANAELAHLLRAWSGTDRDDNHGRSDRQLAHAIPHLVLLMSAHIDTNDILAGHYIKQSIVQCSRV
jgi:hypothetical protein